MQATADERRRLPGVEPGDALEGAVDARGEALRAASAEALTGKMARGEAALLTGPAQDWLQQASCAGPRGHSTAGQLACLEEGWSVVERDPCAPAHQRRRRCFELEHVLSGPDTSPRYFPIGSDAVEIVDRALRVATGDAVSGRKSRPESLRLIARALDWLPRARSAGLLLDCSAADLALLEEEWSILETELSDARGGAASP
jgi:hypothetical protein